MKEDNVIENNELSNKKTELPVSGMYENWFLDYASYVILERAIPSIYDGLKPVQRRILYSMNLVEDGRYNKCANIIGNTMQFHPHGDASISDALVNLGQKNVLIDTQGNWGDIRTGDKAAASRYIEARLTKFTLETIFNNKTTIWKLSYDGRKNEPETLPSKFPLLLLLGAEGIAVGLSTKILPHNFIELIKCSISYLKNRSFKLYPDFLTGGLIDITDYNNGIKGGKIRARAKIKEYDKSTLIITDMPYSVTTSQMIDSIIKANDKGKIRIKKVIDNTAQDVEILVYLAKNQSPGITIDALYAFTDCEISISPNACVIIDDKPKFVGVKDILKFSADLTKNLLKKELEILKKELKEKILYSNLEKIFIENKIYLNIEECETWESVLKTIDKSLDNFKKNFYREIKEDDLVKLTEIKIKRISKYDKNKSNEYLKKLENDLDKTEKNLKNLVEYTVQYYYDILNKYGKGNERKTEISKFDTIKVKTVAANNVKLYVNRKEGFIGFGIKKEEYVCNCSDIDDIIVFCADGSYKVVKINDKVFVGKNIINLHIWKKNDNRMVYNAVYFDGKSKFSYVKRFQVLSSTRDRLYNLSAGNKDSKILYFENRQNGESEVINVFIHSSQKARKKIFEFDFGNLDIKGKSAKGNILSKYKIRSIKHKTLGVSTLSGVDVWYDDSIGKLNSDGIGYLVGNFTGDDLISVFYKDGSYKLLNFDLTHRFDNSEIYSIHKYNIDSSISAIYYNGNLKSFYLKRFLLETTSTDKKFYFISNEKGSKLEFLTLENKTVVEFKYFKNGALTKKILKVDEFIDVKGWKSLGNKLPYNKIRTGSFKFKNFENKSKKEKPEPKNNSINKKVNDKNEFSIGDSIELNLDKDQLKMFDE